MPAVARKPTIQQGTVPTRMRQSTARESALHATVSKYEAGATKDRAPASTPTANEKGTVVARHPFTQTCMVSTLAKVAY